jgi:transposase
MDNASYHSAKLIPNKSENKPVLYKWLKEQALKDPSLNIELPDDIKDILKWELMELVERVSQSESMQSELYQIDKVTKARGHSVLRLPPYNCDLNPIGAEFILNFLKHH